MFFLVVFLIPPHSDSLQVGLSKSIILKFILKKARGSKILSHFNFGDQNVLKMFETKLKFNVFLNSPSLVPDLLKEIYMDVKKTKQNKKQTVHWKKIDWMGQKHDFS